MLFALVYSMLRLLLDLVDVRLRVHDPEVELLLLRHQLRVVRRQVKRPQLTMADRTIMGALSQRMNRAALAGMLVQPETVLGWHRELVRRKWAAFGRRRGPGRPGLDPEIQELILRIAKDNPRWGCVRVRGDLLKLGHAVSATAIRKLLRRHRIGPAPLRSRETWKAFLRVQASAIVLTDFFSVDTVFLRRLYVLLYMELATRRVIWFAVTERPDASWVSQQARNVSWEGERAGCARTIPDPRSRPQVRRRLRPRLQGGWHGRDSGGSNRRIPLALQTPTLRSTSMLQIRSRGLATSVLSGLVRYGRQQSGRRDFDSNREVALRVPAGRERCGADR